MINVLNINDVYIVNNIIINKIKVIVGMYKKSDYYIRYQKDFKKIILY